MAFLSYINDLYWKNVVEKRDPRTENWFLMGCPFKVLSLTALYLYFSTSLGPRLMKNRKPFVLRGIITIYNLLQIILNFTLIIVSIYKACIYNYSFLNYNPIDFSDSAVGTSEKILVYYYYMLKVFDLSDTVFFILRKKFKQVSFLHVYHHTALVIMGYISSAYTPGGMYSFIGLVNAAVHVVMYTYYTQAIITQKLPSWKIIVTRMQLIQFVVLLIHGVKALTTEHYNARACPFIVVLVMQFAFFIYLFGKFYIKEYVIEKKK